MFHIFTSKIIWKTDIWLTKTLMSLLLSYLYQPNIVLAKCVTVSRLFIEKHFAARYLNNIETVESTIVIAISTKHCVGITFYIFSFKTIWPTDIWST